MNDHAYRKKRLYQEWLLTAAIALGALVFLVFADIARPMGNVLYDHLMRLQGFKPSQDIVIVAIDDHTLEQLGGWPIKRSHYTQLLQRLNNDTSRPKAIGFDLLFLDPTPDDSEFAKSMMALNTVLPLEFKLSDEPSTQLVPTLPVEPLPGFATIGHINLAFDHDGVIRGIRTFEQKWPHFGLAMRAAGERTNTAPTQDTGYRRFPMVNPRVGFPSVSFVDALQNNVSRSLLKDKYVLVGVTAPSLGDRYPTLYSGKDNASTPGVAILASVLSADIKHELIKSASAWLIFFSALVPVYAMLHSLILIRPRLTLLFAIGLMFASVALCYATLAWLHVWVNPVPFILVALLIQPLWAWRRLEAIVSLVQDKTADLRQFHANQHASQHKRKSREVVLHNARQLDQAVADISDLLQSKSQRDRALQFLSHDMRTPIASILSLTSKHQPHAHGQNDKIIQHAKALLHMMDDFILTISSETTQYAFKQELLDNLVNDAIEQVADLAQAKGIVLTDHSDTSTIFVMVNTRLFVRALVNLLYNAVKFSEPGTTVRIQTSEIFKTSSHSLQAFIKIENTVATHIASTDLTPSMPGFGLGLDFVDTVIHKHDGQISRHIPSSGLATVTVTLPCMTLSDLSN